MVLWICMKLFSLILAVISLTSFSEAHPGGLDANGGHYNRKTGEYHYHRKPGAKPTAEEKAYWISSTGKTHNKNCRYYGACKGRASDTPSGMNCKICGGAMKASRNWFLNSLSHLYGNVKISINSFLHLSI